MIKIKKTYVCDVCGYEKTQEFELATIDSETPKFSKFDFPYGWFISCNGELICAAHINVNERSGGV